MSFSIGERQRSENKVIGDGSDSGLIEGAGSQTNEASDSSKDAINEALSRLERLKIREEDFCLSEEQIRTNDQLQEDEVFLIRVFVWDFYAQEDCFLVIYYNQPSI